MKKEDAIIVCGLVFGDEGKGAIVDALARRFAPADVVRYNGGPQAGHNVVEPDGRWHCFAQFGAGTFVGDSRTILGPEMLVELENLDAEADALEGKGIIAPRRRLGIEPRCRLITPMQKIVGRMREIARGEARHGSCGQGVGETVFDAEDGHGLIVSDLRAGNGALRKLTQLSALKRGQAQALLKSAPPQALEAMKEAHALLLRRSDPEELYRRYVRIVGVPNEKTAEARIREAAGRALIFEGAQGALLDRMRGFHPYVTKSDTTCRNAFRLLRAAEAPRAPFKLGIMRAYGHRHGAGPFLTEDESLRDRFDDALNRQNPWQGKFRVGWLDLPALRYGIRLNGGVDGLALTGLDRLSGLKTIRLCESYEAPDGRAWSAFTTREAMRQDWIGACRPGAWIELPGWDEDLSGVRRFGDLPKNAQAFVRFLESAEGLKTPVEIVSVGPRSDQKLFLNA